MADTLSLLGQIGSYLPIIRQLGGGDMGTVIDWNPQIGEDEWIEENSLAQVSRRRCTCQRSKQRKLTSF
jgi:hypothetical protein